MARHARSVGALGLAAAILGAPPASQAAPEQPLESCLPADLAVRVQVEEPDVLAARVAALLEARSREDRHAELRRQFEVAGCVELEEQHARRLRTANLICTLPGRTSESIVVGASLEQGGDAAVALLPALVEVLRRGPREHTIRVVAFGRDQHGVALGARHFAESLAGDLPPALFLHIGFVGHGLLRVEPESEERERCLMRGLAARMNLEIGEIRRESLPRLWLRCDEPPLVLRYTENSNCIVVSHRGLTDRAPFLARGIPSAGLTADVQRRASLDPVAHYAGYRLLAVYLTVADGLIGR